MRKYCATSLPRHAEKRQLVVPGRRAPMGMNSMNSRKVTNISFSELATPQLEYINRRRTRWDLILTERPNNDFPRLDIYNAIGIRRDANDLVDHLDLKQDLDDRKANLWFPVALLEGEDGLVAQIQYHAIRARLDRDDNARAHKIVIEYSKTLWNLGIPVVVGTDTNNMKLAKRLFRDAGFSVGATGDVMGVFGLGMEWEGKPSAPEVRWSDHRAPARRGHARKEIVRPKRLPRRLPDPR